MRGGGGARHFYGRHRGQDTFRLGGTRGRETQNPANEGGGGEHPPLGKTLAGDHVSWGSLCRYSFALAISPLGIIITGVEASG